VRNVAKWSAPVLEPEPGARDAWHTSLELARRFMGLDALEPAQVDALVLRQLAGLALEKSRFKDDVSLDQVLEATGGEPGPERILDVLLCLGPYGDGCGVEPEGLTLARVQQHEHGMDLGPLEPMLPGHVATESGKIELAPERLVADLPRLDAWLAEEPGPGLRLINRRDVRSMNSWLHNLPALAKGRDRCTLQIHPEDAAERGLAEGGEALVRSRVGEIRVSVELTEDVMRGVVSLPHGFDHAGSGVALSVATGRPGANVNAVTDDVPSDAPSGASMLFGGPVEVEALSEAS
jgi:anaerobic selenocysteine-containing dehydrogenase